jgi:hypothetical protein
MAGLTKGKHVIAEIDGVRCTIVESGISEARMQFLKEILSENKLEVKVQEEKKENGDASTYTLGVTDLVFNPVIAIYARKLYHADGRIITPAYWNQFTDRIDNRYWRFVNKQN